MAKMYYNPEETLAKLGCSEDQLKAMVRNGKLREFRDAGKLNYRVEEVDKLVQGQQNLSAASGSGELSLEDSGEIALMPDDSGSGVAMKAEDKPGKPGPGGSDAPVDLSGTSGEMKLDESGEIGLSDSASDLLKLEESGAGEMKLEDSAAAGGDALSLDEVDKERVEGMKKDDTVITNIGISVFDDDDLEIAADPMAKTMLTGGDEHLGLDGSAGGSGLLDLTRESDDTSLGAELLEGIDMGDTAETIAPTQTSEAVEQGPADMGGGLPEPSLEPTLQMGPRTVTVGYVEAASPAFTGLLAAAAISLALTGALAVATTMGAWPTYLGYLADSFWISLGGMIGLGAIAGGIGMLVGMKPSSPRPPKPAKKAKGKKGKEAAAEA